MKPFTVSNYTQKLINELEASQYVKDESNLKIILEEISKFANHYSTTENLSYANTNAYYIDPRILIGYCLRNQLNFESKISSITAGKNEHWTSKWLHKDNI